MKPATAFWPGSVPAAGASAERAVLPVAGLVGDGPAVVRAVVEAREDLAGRHRVIRHRALGREGRAVEVADEVLAAGAARDAARVEVHDEHPLGVRRVAVDREREQVGALPDAARGVGRAEVAEVRPRLQVVAAGEHHLVLQRLDGAMTQYDSPVSGFV